MSFPLPPQVYVRINIQMSFWEIVQIEYINCFKTQDDPWFLKRKLEIIRSYTVDVIDYVIFRNYILSDKHFNEIFFFKPAINILWNISTFGWHHKLSPFILLLFDKVVKHSIDNSFRFSIPIQTASINMIDSSWFNRLDQSSKHFIVELIGWFSVVCTYSHWW